MWYDLWQLVTVDSFTLFTLLWPGLRGRSVFKNNKNRVASSCLSPSTSQSRGRLLPLCFLSLLSNIVKQEFVCKQKLCKHFLFISNKIYLYYLSFILSIHATLSSVPGSPIEIHLFCSNIVSVLSVLLSAFVLKVRYSTIINLFVENLQGFWNCVLLRTSMNSVNMQRLVKNSSFLNMNSLLHRGRSIAVNLKPDRAI